MLKNMLSPQEKKAVDQFRKEVSEIAEGPCLNLRLFGSRARAEGNEDSDLDILVLLAEEDHQKKIRIWDAAYDIFTKTDIMISPLVLSEQQYERLKERERLIARDIEKEGIDL